MRPYHCVLAALAVLGTPALAATDTAAASKPADSAQAAKAASSVDRKYCITSDETTTDTRIRTPECRTKSEWTKRGVDIDELQKQQQ